jgi:DNA-binding MarR family transcriptional regulator
VERTLQFADMVTRELLPLVPKEALVLDVTMAQLKIMMIIYLGGATRMSLLAEKLGVSLPTVTKSVDRLVAREIVGREGDPEDRRVVLCRLTDNGQAMIVRLWQSARERTRMLLNALSGRELDAVNRALEYLLKAGQKVRQTEPDQSL